VRAQVRETLYFDTVEQLNHCLGSLQSHPLIEIVRVKSTFHEVAHNPEYLGSFEWAGWRYVRVNVRLAGSEEAQSLCVDTHVCELLLVLTDMGRVKTDEMRERYRQWRVIRRHLRSRGSPHNIVRWMGLLMGTTPYLNQKDQRNDDSAKSVISDGRDSSNADDLGEGRELESVRQGEWRVHDRMAGKTETADGVEIRKDCAMEIKEEAVVPGAQGEVEYVGQRSPGHSPTGRGLQNSLVTGRNAATAGRATTWGLTLCAEVFELIQSMCHMSGVCSWMEFCLLWRVCWCYLNICRFCPFS